MEETKKDRGQKGGDKKQVYRKKAEGAPEEEKKQPKGDREETKQQKPQGKGQYRPKTAKPAEGKREDMTGGAEGGEEHKGGNKGGRQGGRGGHQGGRGGHRGGHHGGHGVRKEGGRREFDRGDMSEEEYQKYIQTWHYKYFYGERPKAERLTEVSIDTPIPKMPTKEERIKEPVQEQFVNSMKKFDNLVDTVKKDINDLRKRQKEIWEGGKIGTGKNAKTVGQIMNEHIQESRNIDREKQKFIHDLKKVNQEFSELVNEK